MEGINKIDKIDIQHFITQGLTSDEIMFIISRSYVPEVIEEPIIVPVISETEPYRSKFESIKSIRIKKCFL